jgi:ferritin-like protein
LEQLVLENAQLEAAILAGRERLETAMQHLGTEQATLKQQIRKARSEASDAEKRIVARIDELKVKLAQKELK